VVDEIAPTFAKATVGKGTGLHSAAMHWHLDPAWTVRTDAHGQLRATHVEGDEAWLLHDGGKLSVVHGDEESGLGWYAPIYGTLIPTWTARVTHEAVAPFSIVTWIGGAAETAHGAPSLDRIETTPDAGGRAIAARVVTGTHMSAFLLRPGEPRAREGRACGVLDYQTDARMLHVRTADDRLLALDLADGSHALALRDDWISVEADEPVPDLHMVVSDTALELSASEPPRQLRIQGTCIAQLRAVYLNGRPYPRPSTDRPHTLLIAGGEWGQHPLVHNGARFALGHHAPSCV
jgi:hypothetical protein